VTKHSPGPWEWDGRARVDSVPLRHDAPYDNGKGQIVPYVSGMVALPYAAGNEDGELEANARLIAAAPDLLKAAVALEAAEHAHANCDECNGEGMPELCPKCFPLFDDARLKRRAAIAKAEPVVPIAVVIIGETA